MYEDDYTMDIPDEMNTKQEHTGKSNQEIIKEIDESFRLSAEKFWGQVLKTEVMKISETENASNYLMCATCKKNGVYSKVLQIWYYSHRKNTVNYTNKIIKVEEEMWDTVSTLFTEPVNWNK